MNTLAYIVAAILGFVLLNIPGAIIGVLIWWLVQRSK